MKAIIIVLAIFLVAVLNGLTDEKTKLRKYKESCISECGVDPTVVENAKKGEIPENDGFACFSACFLKKIGIINADGEINWDIIAKIPAKHNTSKT